MEKVNRVAVVSDVWRANAITHPAPHHADEVFATAMLSLIKEVHVFRTRDLELILKVKDLKHNVVVYDVGGIYDPDLLFFDHHQKEFEEHYSDFMKYSSAGLVWRRFSKEILAKFDCPINLLVEASVVISNDLIYGIDLRDNGCASSGKEMSVSKMIDLFNPNWDEAKQDVDGAFLKAVKLAQEILVRKIRKTISSIKARERIGELIELSDGKLLIMSEFVGGWIENTLRSHNPKARRLIYGIFPDYDGEWRVQAIPPALNRIRDKRKPFPKAWCGVPRTELVKITGIESVVFCHPNGFIAGALTYEDAIKIAELALAL